MKIKISEKILRRIWKNQNFINTPLLTSDGKIVKVVYTGKSNPDGGPDFLNAKIYIGDKLYVGDIEIHMNTTDWKTHQHDRDSKYNRVILHIVYSSTPDKVQYKTTTKSNRIIPTLILQPYINESIIENIYEEIYKEPIQEFTQLKCRDKNKNISDNFLKDWLIKLSVERLEYKVRRMDERLKELIRFEKLKEPIIKYEGVSYEINIEDLPNFEVEFDQKDFTNIKHWEQLFYEYLLESLGYTKNQLPFLKLSRMVTLNTIRELDLPKIEAEKIAIIESILFIYSGLLPETNKIKEKETLDYVNSVKKNFELVKPTISSLSIKPYEWQFFRLRPESFPTLRLSGAANLTYKILYENLFKNVLKTILDNTIEPADKITELIKLFRVSSKNYWKTHYRFDKKSGKEIKVLIGKEKIIEIIINVVIPILLLYARIFRKRELRENLLKIYEQIKINKSNFLIKKMDEELLHKNIKIDSAILYQGLIHLYKFYCSENKCNECLIYKSI